MHVVARSDYKIRENPRQTCSSISSVAVRLYPASPPLYGGLPRISLRTSRLTRPKRANYLTYLAKFFAPTIAALPTAYAANSVLHPPLCPTANATRS